MSGTQDFGSKHEHWHPGETREHLDDAIARINGDHTQEYSRLSGEPQMSYVRAGIQAALDSALGQEDGQRHVVYEHPKAIEYLDRQEGER